MVKNIVRSVAVVMMTLCSSAVFAQDVELKQARYFFSDLSGSCEVCATFNGLVEVENVAPEKAVVIHYTGNFLNSWSTVDAEFVGPSRPGYEYWSFSTAVAGGMAEFAVEYQVQGTSVWDNNAQANYVIQAGEPLLLGADINVVLTRNVNPIIFRFPSAVSYIGSVHVRDLAFEKDVRVRYTTNGWQTWQEAPATFGQTETNGLEKWNFSIDFPVSAQSVELAVGYTVDGQTYWDNNLGANYRFVLP